jgi:hypothetical protein
MATLLALAIGGVLAYELYSAHYQTPTYSYNGNSPAEKKVLQSANEYGYYLPSLRLQSTLPYSERQPTFVMANLDGSEILDPASLGNTALQIQQEQVQRYSNEAFKHAAHSNGASIMLPNTNRVSLPFVRLATRSGAGTAAAYPLATFEKQYNHPEGKVFVHKGGEIELRNISFSYEK